MKKMMLLRPVATKFFLTLALALSWCQLMAKSKATPMKIGQADVEYIFGELPEAKRIESELQSFVKQLQKPLRAKEEEGKQKLQVFQANMANMTEEEKEKGYTELKKLEESIKKLDAELQEKLIEKQKSLLSPVYEKIQRTIKQVAQQHGYTHVLNGSINNIPLLLYVAEEHNLSERVLKQLRNKPKQGKKK